MRYNINIDQRFCLEWGLNFAEGAVFGILYNLSSWADPVVIDGQIFYHASRNKVMDELPMLTDKPDTIYRIFKHLSDPQRALIQYEKDGRQDLIRLLEANLQCVARLPQLRELAKMAEDEDHG